MHKEVKCHSLWLDTTLVLSSFVLAFGCVSNHDPETKVSKTLAAFLLMTGSWFYVKLTHLLNKLLLSTNSGLKLIRRFNLSLSDCLDISNKWVASSLCMFIKASCDKCFFSPELCQRSSPASRWSSGFWCATILVEGTFWQQATFFPSLTHGKIERLRLSIV